MSITDPYVPECFIHFLAAGRWKKTTLSIERNLTDSRLIVLLWPPR